MNLPTMIRESTTLAQLLELEKKYSLSEHEYPAVLPYVF